MGSLRTRVRCRAAAGSPLAMRPAGRAPVSPRPAASAPAWQRCLQQDDREDRWPGRQATLRLHRSRSWRRPRMPSGQGPEPSQPPAPTGRPAPWAEPAPEPWLLLSSCFPTVARESSLTGVPVSPKAPPLPQAQQPRVSGPSSGLAKTSLGHPWASRVWHSWNRSVHRSPRAGAESSTQPTCLRSASAPAPFGPHAQPTPVRVCCSQAASGGLLGDQHPAPGHWGLRPRQGGVQGRRWSRASF